MGDAGPKGRWVTPSVETSMAFEALAGTCTAVAEYQEGCATDGYGGMPAHSFT